MSFLSRLGSLTSELCPGRCPRCRSIGSSGFCAACRADFARVPDPCPGCGLSRPVADCPRQSRGWLLDEVRAPFLYAPPLNCFLQTLKYRQNRNLGIALGELLRDELVAAAADCDAVVVMPLHAARFRQRTFNQADEIARPLARGLRRPILTRGLGRAIDTPPQASLSKRERLDNPARAFFARRDLSGLEIAIVDDVITTGATVNALAAALKAAGAARVAAFAVARAV